MSRAASPDCCSRDPAATASSSSRCCGSSPRSRRSRRSSRSTSSTPRPRFTVHDERLQAETLMRAAIELSVYRSVANPQAPPSRGSFAFRLGNANVAAEFRRRDRAHRPQHGAEGVARRPVRRARRAAQSCRRLRGPDHRVALARRRRAMPDRAADLSRGRARLFAARRAVPAHPRSSAWCSACPRRWSSARRRSSRSISGQRRSTSSMRRRKCSPRCPA